MKDKWRAVKEAGDDGGDCGYPTIVTLLLRLRRHHRHRHHHHHRHNNRSHHYYRRHHRFSYYHQMDYPTNITCASIMIWSHPYHSVHLPTPTLLHLGHHWLALFNTIVFGFCCSHIVWRFGVRARGPWNLWSCVNVGQDLSEVLICAQQNVVWGSTAPLSLSLVFPRCRCRYKYNSWSLVDNLDIAKQMNNYTQ